MYLLYAQRYNTIRLNHKRFKLFNDKTLFKILNQKNVPSLKPYIQSNKSNIRLNILYQNVFYVLMFEMFTV